jgi:hypothetical protein
VTFSRNATTTYIEDYMYNTDARHDKKLSNLILENVRKKYLSQATVTTFTIHIKILFTMENL